MGLNKKLKEYEYNEPMIKTRVRVDTVQYGVVAPRCFAV